SFSLSRSGVPPILHSFPTRRSSDLARAHEVLEKELGDVVPRDGERGRALEAMVALGAGGERDVFEEGQNLNRGDPEPDQDGHERDRKSTRLNSSHDQISYAVFCLKK